MPRDILTFRISLRSLASESFRDLYRARLFRHLPAGMIYDQILSIELDGESVRPTNQSLARVLDLQLNRIEGGSHLAIAYQVRVHFMAEPMKVSLGGTRLRWSRVARIATAPTAIETVPTNRQVEIAEDIQAAAELPHDLLTGMHLSARTKTRSMVSG